MSFSNTFLCVLNIFEVLTMTFPLQSGSQASIYSIVTVLVNLVNAYDQQEMVPEMMELAKFAKQHIPEEHELDDPDFINKRIEVT